MILLLQEKNLLRNLLKNKDREEVTKIINSLSDEEVELLMYDWTVWARDSQLPPKELDDLSFIWFILAGRGYGKTRTGAETVKMWVEQGYKRIAFIGPTPADARDVMVEGESGILSVYPEHLKPLYEPSKRRITFHTGAIATIYSGYKPDQLRGPQHDAFWADELAAWKYMQDTWDNLMMGLRLGNPRGIVTTTPRPLPLIKELVKDKRVITTKGSTYENKANLPKTFIDSLIDKYSGTRLGRQELEAEILEDNPDALWNREIIENSRVKTAPDLFRIVVAVDPNASNNEKSDEIGIVVAGVSEDGHYYILDDNSLLDTPAKWAEQAVKSYNTYKADLIIAEKNQGGNMVEFVIKTIDKEVPYKGIHASKGKYTRAEPISSLYEQGKVHHVGYFRELEDELCEWVPGNKSPNRLDALVWALTELSSTKKGKWGW